MIDASKPAPTHTWLTAVLAALISALFFGLNAVASKLLFSPAAPAHFDAVSLFVARGFWSLPLFLVLALATMPHALPPLTWKHAGLFAMCGITYGPGTNALSALGASETSAGHAVLLLSLFPPLAAVLASVFLRERLTVLRVVAILIGVVGAAILTLSKSGAGSSLAGDAMIGGTRPDLGISAAWHTQTGYHPSGSLRGRRFRDNRLFAADGNGSGRGAD